jgi:transposase
VKQANESELPVSETARNLGVNVNTLFTWIQKYSQPVEKRSHQAHAVA